MSMAADEPSRRVARRAPGRPTTTAEPIEYHKRVQATFHEENVPSVYAHGTIDVFNGKKKSGVGLIDGYDPLDPMAPIAIRSRALIEPEDSLNIGPLKKIYLIWMVGASCAG